jgi:hypothetical protein
VLDRLACAFGHDILDALLCSTCALLGVPLKGLSQSRSLPLAVVHFSVALAYMALHSGIYFLQFTTLNVAFISSSTTLLTVLVSNNFVELKGSIFKKCGPENLFQLCGGDIVERFNGFVFFSLATLQHLQSEQWAASPAWLWRWFELGSLFFVSEFVVDWTKHAFISKFNDIQPDLYSKFSNAMYKDLTVNPSASSSGVQVDRMQVVSRRIGFTPLPLACVFVRLVYTALPFFSWFNLPNLDPVQPLLLLLVIALAFLTCTLLKLLVCIVLLGRACINRMALPPQGEEEDNELERFNFARHIVF